jgi:hypothetical protein
MQGDDFRLSVVGGIVHELKVLLAESSGSFRTTYTSRDCNRVAHELASIGCNSNDLAPMVQAGVPSCIMSMVSSDLADVVE